MNDYNDKSLVSRFYQCEKTAFILSALLLFLNYVDLSNIKIPIIDIKFRDKSKIPVVIIILLLTTIIYLIIEWHQSSKFSRDSKLSKIRLIFILTISTISIWNTIPKITIGTSFFLIKRAWYIIYPIFGLLIGSCLSTIVIASLMIRTGDEAKKFRLPRVPFLTRGQYITRIPFLMVLLFCYFITNHYAPEQIHLLGFVFAEVCIIMSLVIFYSPFRNTTINLKELYALYDRNILLKTLGPQMEPLFNIPEEAMPKDIQKSIKNYCSAIPKDIKINVHLLQELKFLISPPNWNPEIDTHSDSKIVFSSSINNDPGKVKASILVYDNNAKLPKHSLEIELSIDQINHKANDFIKQNYKQKFSIKDLMNHSIYIVASETLLDKMEYPLHNAAASGDIQMLEYYLKQGHNPNEQADSGWTPLLWACANGYPAIVKRLLDAGANPNISNILLISPLHYSARYGNLIIIKQLIDYGADINLQDGHGETPLAVATKNGNLKIVETLIQKKANVTIKNFRGESALDLAYKCRNGKIARIIKQATKNQNCIG